MKKKSDTWDIKPSETSINEGVGGGGGSRPDLSGIQTGNSRIHNLAIEPQ